VAKRIWERYPGAGGMIKNIFTLEKSNLDKEIERLKTLIDLGM
jgi:hypothetical protein